MATLLANDFHDAFRNAIKKRNLDALQALVVDETSRSALNGNLLNEPPLCQAVQWGWEEGMDTLLHAGADVDVSVCTNYPETPLIVAVRNNNLKLLEVLLAHGANPNVKVKSKTALHETFYVSQPKVKIAQALLRNGAHPNGLDANGRTPLSLAVQQLASLALVESFIAAEVNPLEQDLDGHTALNRWTSRTNVNRVDHAVMTGVLQRAIETHIDRERAALHEALNETPAPLAALPRHRL